MLHVDRPHVPDGPGPDRRVIRERRHLERCLLDVQAALERLDSPVGAPVTPNAPVSLARAAHRARRVRRRAEALAVAQAALDDERSVLLRYREFFQVFESLVGHELTWPDGQAFYVVLRKGAGGALTELQRSLEAAVGGEVELLHRELSSGEWAVLILASSHVASKVSALLSASRVEELPAPAGSARRTCCAPCRRSRRGSRRSLRRVGGWTRSDRRLRRRRAPGSRSCAASCATVCCDSMRGRRVYAAEHLFVIEGWLPAARLEDLDERVRRALGPEVVVSTLGAEDWRRETTPVALHNPPLFRPFEVLTRMLPLPKYGTIDPTPFVAIFFPAFFGLMLGDVGYGLMLAALAGCLRLKSTPDTALRSVSTVALACASSTDRVRSASSASASDRLAPPIGLRPFFNREQAHDSLPRVRRGAGRRAHHAGPRARRRERVAARPPARSGGARSSRWAC